MSQAYANAFNTGQSGMVGAPYGAGSYGPAAELSNKSALAGELDGSEMRVREMEG